MVPFSIRNWAVVVLLPSTPRYQPGRTVPVKFSLRIAEVTDPTQPFVYTEQLEIRIYDQGEPKTILHRAVFGEGARDYRIDLEAQKYITNFKTKKTPAVYIVDILRLTTDFPIGSFSFETKW